MYWSNIFIIPIKNKYFKNPFLNHPAHYVLESSSSTANMYLIKTNEKLLAKYGDLFKEGSGSSGHGEGGGNGNCSPLKVGGDKCTGFIVVGSYTKDGKIVCGHNSFDNFISGQNFNIILDVNPTKGNRFLMQCAPGYISSQTENKTASTRARFPPIKNN